MSRRVAVVGAGVGGLAAAIRLAAAGAEVDVFERRNGPGGKLRQVEVGGRLLDAGPSVVTMPFVFADLFAIAGERLADHLTFLPVEPACRHFFSDGSRLDLFNDPVRSRAAIRELAGEGEARGFDALVAQGAKIFDIVRGPFLELPVPTLADLANPRNLYMVPRFLRIGAGSTLWSNLSGHFRDPRLRQLYGRYATYNGSSPFHCPGTLAVIIHVEQGFGVHVVAGGLYRLAEALRGLAERRGVRCHFGVEVEGIAVEGGRVTGLQVDGQRLAADLVVANCDAAHLYGALLGEAGARLARGYRRLEPSLSAYLLLARADVGDFPLAHHNVFFSSDYPREFEALVKRRRPPEEPTVYLCAQDRVPDGQPGGQERHLLLANAPALPLPGGAAVDWEAEGPGYRRRVAALLDRHRFPFQPSAERAVSPADFAALFPSSRGSLYGAASNSRLAAFERPANRVPGIAGLYLCGGSAHPGAGLPMVALSGRITAAQALHELGLGPPVRAITG